MIVGINTVLRPISVTLATLAIGVIAATAVHQKIGREGARNRAYFDKRFADLEQAAMYYATVQGQAAQRHAEDLYERGLKEMDNRFAALERAGRIVPRPRRRRRGPQPAEVDRFLSDIDRDNVVPMPDPRKVRGSGDDLPGVQ
jgi:hypothetical protein